MMSFFQGSVKSVYCNEDDGNLLHDMLNKVVILSSREGLSLRGGTESREPSWREGSVWGSLGQSVRGSYCGGSLGKRQVEP